MSHFEANNMVLEQFLHNHSSESGIVSTEKWKSISSSINPREDNPTGGLDCNICLDLVHEPVVTLCGHLYCWPCIYKWIHLQSFSTDNLDPEQTPQCPVCKCEVSDKTLVPLYGRGQSTKASEGKESPDLGIVIPRRPPSPTCRAHTTGSHPSLQLHQRRNLQRPAALSLDGTTMTADAFPPMIGEMVYARIFDNPATTLYSSPHSYRLAGAGSPRVRRHIMEADRSLGRVCFFLCCCIALCLLLF